MSAPHVLLVGMNYWPEETGNAPYTTGLAEYLAADGYRVTVIAGLPYYPHWKISKEYRYKWRFRETVRNVEIRRFRQYIPSRQSGIRRALFEVSFLGHAVTGVRGIHADVVIGIVPSLGDAILSTLVAKSQGIPLGLIFQDLVGMAVEGSGVSGGKKFAAGAQAMERWSARQASSVAVVSENFRPYIENLGVDGSRITLLPNWSHIGTPGLERSVVREQMGWKDNETIVLHAGAISLRQGLENVVEAARHANGVAPHLRFVLMGHGSQRASLEELGAGLPNLDFLDAQPADRFPEVLAAADILLVNERSSVENMSLPSKLTSYFVAGRPIVVAAAPTGATAREAERSGAAVVTAPEDPKALVATIDSLASNVEACIRMGAAGPAYASQHLSAERSLARGADFVRTLLE